MDSPDAAHAEKLIDVRPDRAITLDNAICVYCGHPLTPKTRSKEHVVGRRFVPKGKLDGQWNLILNACRSCNTGKADLENDISAITLQPDLSGRHPHGDGTALQDAVRKAEKAISRRTKKPVKDSHEAVTLKTQLAPGVTATFNFTGPAQIEDRRAFELARLHLMAFFFWLTYDQAAKRGGYWQYGFHPVMTVTRGDWGNPVMRAFGDAVAEWDYRLFGVTADGYFKVMIRRHPSAECWSWALEWNLSRRLIGFFGEREPAQQIVSEFALPRKHLLRQADGEWLRYSVETPLSEDDDRLFFLHDQ